MLWAGVLPALVLTIGGTVWFRLAGSKTEPTRPPPTINFFSFLTRRVEQLAALPKEARTSIGTPAFAVSADGRWILYVQVDRAESDIVLVENFR